MLHPARNSWIIGKTCRGRSRALVIVELDTVVVDHRRDCSGSIGVVSYMKEELRITKTRVAVANSLKALLRLVFSFWAKEVRGNGILVEWNGRVVAGLVTSAFVGLSD